MKRMLLFPMFTAVGICNGKTKSTRFAYHSAFQWCFLSMPDARFDFAFAMEQILVKRNPVAYELYLDTIKNLRAQKTAEVNRVLTQAIKSKPTER